ncbi:MAG: serine/threonine-protein kinase [Myxococcota bacterium]
MVPADEPESSRAGTITVADAVTRELEPEGYGAGESTQDEDGADEDFESLLRQVARAPSIETLPSGDEDLASGTILDDCFRIVRPLGRGGMGVVYLADHLQLERQVALKLHSAAAGSSGTSRLLREARTMAKLVHDNVITVYDVGTVDQQVYIAMEYVDGGTVRDWLDEQSRSWREILRVFVAAGRGLAAAHHAGLVHRDFKPDNVLVGRDGRVRVADFGLARAAEGEGGVPLRWRDAARGTPSGIFAAVTTEQGLRLTATGVLVGTPAYMAPEQHEGQAADPRCDQFAFCVSLYEALYGERPFRANTLVELVDRMVGGDPIEPPREHDVPPFVRASLRRGLSRDPAKRFASMEGLLRALEHDPAAARWRRVALVAGAVTVAVGVGVAQRVATRDPCAGGRARLAGVWDAARGASMEQALAERGGSLGAVVGPRVRARLDRYGDDWIEAYRDACEATHRRQVQSEEALDLRMACLDVRRAELAALAEVLAEGDEDVVARADRASLSLSSLSPCAEVEALRRVEPIAAKDRPAADVVRRGLARAKEEIDAGRYAVAQQLADQGLVDAQALGYVSLEAEALYRVAQARNKGSRHREAVEAFEASLEAAVAAGDDRLALSVTVALIYSDGYQRERYEQGERWLRHADAWLQRVGDTGVVAVRRALNGGLMRRKQGRIDESVASMQQALTLIEGLEGERAVDARQVVLAALAVTLAQKGDIEGSIQIHAEALEQAESLYGPMHPSLATELNNFGAAWIQRGDMVRAEQLIRRALEIRQASLRPDHYSVLESQLNLGITLVGLGRLDEALASLRAAQSHAREADPRVRANLQSNLGGVYTELGRYEDAQAHFRRSQAVLREAFPPDDPSLLGVSSSLANVANRRKRYAEAIAYAREGLEAVERSSREGLEGAAGYLRLNLADALFGEGQTEQARQQYERALALMEATLGPEHPHLYSPLIGVAECWLDADLPDRAEPLMRRALALVDRLDAGNRAYTRLLMARVLWAQNLHQDARQMAETARDDPEIDPSKRQEIEQWLQSHPI